MVQVADLDSNIVYSGEKDTVSWKGIVFGNTDKFQRYMREVVKPRIEDTESLFEEEINDLDRAEVDGTFLDKFLSRSPRHKFWEIGEALAECLLRDDSNRNVVWPWNHLADRRTPRASLPGSDLVGFCCENGKTMFLLGQVKTSSRAETPPSVMRGKKGLECQIKELVFCTEVQKSLLRWLHRRCRHQPLYNLYQDALRCYFGSGGKEFFVVGVLVRDTPPDERDLKSTSNNLVALINLPTRAELNAWYFPISTTEWSTLL